MKYPKSILVLLIFTLTLLSLPLSPCNAQGSWNLCKAPAFGNRVDDIFMVTPQIGYAVAGDGRIVKTTDGGITWIQVLQNSSIYYRSVEFVTPLKGFAGGFQYGGGTTNIFLATNDGGKNWSDITYKLSPSARRGICGLAAPDSNTIYGCGNWFDSTGYIVKSVDGGNSWSFIDMKQYAKSIIDMYFINKDTGFATGRSSDTLHTGIILYTTDGGQSWTTKFRNTTRSEYVWKIQRLSRTKYFASLEDFTAVYPSILTSVDGGMSWTTMKVRDAAYNIEGIGFIDSLNGWTGGDWGYSFATTDGGKTWTADSICQLMNRVFRVNDTLLFATGTEIWRYSRKSHNTGVMSAGRPSAFAFMQATPNPAETDINIRISLTRNTRAVLTLMDGHGREVAQIDNSDKEAGDWYYRTSCSGLAPGIYYLVLKTHEDKVIIKLSVANYR